MYKYLVAGAISPNTQDTVIPAHAGIHKLLISLDAGLRRCDENRSIRDALYVIENNCTSLCSVQVVEKQRFSTTWQGH